MLRGVGDNFGKASHTEEQPGSQKRVSWCPETKDPITRLGKRPASAALRGLVTSGRVELSRVRSEGEAHPPESDPGRSPWTHALSQSLCCVGTHLLSMLRPAPLKAN